MTASGIYTFSPEVAELVDEAAERAQIDPASVGGRFIRSARRSLNYMLLDWQASGILLWTVGEQTFSPAENDTTVAFATGSFEVLEAGVRDSDGVQTPMDIIGRAEYFEIPDKTMAGRPDRIWPERLATSMTGYFWQAMGPTAYTIVCKVVKQVQEAGVASNTLQLPPQWYDAAADDLSVRLARKFNPAVVTANAAFALRSMERARRTNRDPGDTTLRARWGRR